MSDSITIAQSLKSLEIAPQLDSYTKVIIQVDDDTVIEVGDDSGRTLEMQNPFGTQAMAQTILESLRGFKYQPYTARGALLDPAAEIGDAANVRGIQGGIYTRTRYFSRIMNADISAPYDEEIDQEYSYETPERREFKRQISDIKASLIIANDRIDASVSKTGGERESFAWSLTSGAHKWYANGKEVMSVTASGLSVKGNVEAETGKIGGFTISASAIYNNLSEYGGTQSSGVYIGTNGLQLGQRFKVDTSGNVTATRLTVDTLVIGGTPVSAATLNSRANSAYSSTSPGGYCYGGAGGGYSFSKATEANTTNYPRYFRADTLRSEYFYFKGGNVYVYTNNGVKYLCLLGGN